MKAFIPAAGIGSRLRPITNFKPKALVEIAGRPMLEWIILKLKASGVDQVIINIHHYPDQIRDFIRKKKSYGIEIAFSDETDHLLDTGGGLWKAKWFFEDGKPFFVHNVDIFSSLDLADLLQTRSKNNALACLAVRDRETSRYLHFDNMHKLTGWEHMGTGEKKGVVSDSNGSSKLAFSGIHLIDPYIFKAYPGPEEFSLIDAYLELCAEHTITGFEHNDGHWIDMGKIKDIDKAEAIMAGVDQ